MKISNTGIALIKEFEGLRLAAYWDSTGKVWTIGYGHTGGVKKTDVITEEQAEEFLRKDLESAEKDVSKYSKYNFNQNEFDALVSFTFNCGGGNLAKLTDNGNRSKATIAEKLLLYTKSGGVELIGLVRRRKAEQALFKKPIEINYFPRYIGQSKCIDEVFISIGACGYYDTNMNKPLWKARKPIAAANGYPNYTGKEIENIRLMELARLGLLIVPER